MPNNEVVSSSNLTYIKTPLDPMYADKMDHYFSDGKLILYVAVHSGSSVEYESSTMNTKGSIPENVSGFTKFNVEWYWNSRNSMTIPSASYGFRPSFQVSSGSAKTEVYIETNSTQKK